MARPKEPKEMIDWPLSDEAKRFIAISGDVLSCLCELYPMFGRQYKAITTSTFDDIVLRGILLGVALRWALQDGIISQEEHDITARAYGAESACGVV